MRGQYQALVPTITGPVAAAASSRARLAGRAERHEEAGQDHLPGPLTIGDSVADEYYRDDARAARRSPMR